MIEYVLPVFRLGIVSFVVASSTSLDCSLPPLLVYDIWYPVTPVVSVGGLHKTVTLVVLACVALRLVGGLGAVGCINYDINVLKKLLRELCHWMLHSTNKLDIAYNIVAVMCKAECMFSPTLPFGDMMIVSCEKLI